MLQSILGLLRREMSADPEGDNSLVETFREARINDRKCTRIRVKHPERREGFTYFIADVYLDDELQLPLRVASFDWPRGSKQPKLISEYNYTRLKLNVGFDPSEFTDAFFRQD